jgi:hypothetical protein
MKIILKMKIVLKMKIILTIKLILKMNIILKIKIILKIGESRYNEASFSGHNIPSRPNEPSIYIEGGRVRYGSSHSAASYAVIGRAREREREGS